MQMQPSHSGQPSATPQQEAMRVLRERYERGEIAFESFQRGLRRSVAGARRRRVPGDYEWPADAAHQQA